MKDKSIEEIIGKSWEKINHELYDRGGVNPYAYRLGFLDGYKQKDERIKSLEDELKKYSDNEICSECGQPDGKHRKRCSEYYRYMMDNDSDLGAQS